VGASTPASTGHRGFADLLVHRKTLAYDLGEREVTNRKVTHAYQAQSESVAILDFDSEQVCCTPRYRFFIGQWKAASKLGDRVFCRD
jgi:hypothetical protein